MDYEHPSTPSKPSWANGGIPHFQASTYRSNKLGHKTSRREAIFFSFQVSLTRAGKTCLPVRLNAFLLINHTSHGLAKYGMIQGEQVWENTFLFPSDIRYSFTMCHYLVKLYSRPNGMGSIHSECDGLCLVLLARRRLLTHRVWSFTQLCTVVETPCAAVV